MSEPEGQTSARIALFILFLMLLALFIGNDGISTLIAFWS